MTSEPRKALILWFIDPLINLRTSELVDDVVVEAAQCQLCGYKAQHLLSMEEGDSPDKVYGRAEHPSDSDFELSDSIDSSWRHDTGRREAIGVGGITTPPTDELEQFMADHIERIHPGRTFTIHYAT